MLLHLVPTESRHTRPEGTSFTPLSPSSGTAGLPRRGSGAGGGGCSAAEGPPRFSTTVGADNRPVPLAHTHSPCRSLLLATSRSHSASCRSSPRLLSARTVLACLSRRSHSERWRCPALSDLTLRRDDGDSIDRQVNDRRNLIG